MKTIAMKAIAIKNNCNNYLSDLCGIIKLRANQGLLPLRKNLIALSCEVRSSRVIIRVNNSKQSSHLKRELYQYSDRKSTIHCISEKEHHRTNSFLHLSIIQREIQSEIIRSQRIEHGVCETDSHRTLEGRKPEVLGYGKGA